MDQTYEDGATVTIHGPLGAGPMTDEHVRRQVGAVLDGIGDRRTDDRAGDPLALAAVPGEGRFVRDFLTAPELVRVAERLIDGCPELEHLAGVPIRWFWKQKWPKSGDKGAYGKCLKAGGLIAALANTDFYAWLAADLCRDAGITNRQLEALVFHELCFPAGVTVAGPRVDASMARWYAGQLVEIATAAGHLLSGTPNHPVLTDRGWVPLGLLREGDHVVGCGDPERVALAVDPNEHQVPAEIEQVARSGRVPLRLVPPAAEHFDADVADGEVDVVAAHGKLRDRLEPALHEHLEELALSVGRSNAPVLAARRDLGDGLLPVLLAAPRADGGRHARPSLLFGRAHHPDGLCLVIVPDRGTRRFQHRGDGSGSAPPPLAEGVGRLSGQVRRHDRGPVDVLAPGVGVLGAERVRLFAAAQRYPRFGEGAGDRLGVDADRLRQRLLGGPGQVTLSQVVKVEIRPFRGHVYNLQTSQNWYIANGIVAHNCHLERREDKDGNETYELRGHDFAGFAPELSRYGAWTHELGEARDAFAQLGLDLGAGR